jgi:hypothetical protein
MRGIRCTFGSDRVRRAPAVAGKVLGMVATAPAGLTGLRDRASLLIGFGGAPRRSELVALDVADIEEAETGLHFMIRRSKTDEEGQAATIGIARGDVACPVKALRAWLAAAGIEAGPRFRPIKKAGTVRASRLTCRRWRRWVRSGGILGAFPAGRFPYVRGGQGRVYFQDDGRFPAQIGGHPAGLCSGCRVIQGSCGYRFALKRALRRCRVGKVQRHFLDV